MKSAVIITLIAIILQEALMVTHTHRGKLAIKGGGQLNAFW